MELTTKDGMVMISQRDYEIVHGLSKVMPDLLHSVVIATNKCDEKVEVIKREKDSFCKLRRLLVETQDKLNLLFPNGKEKENVKNTDVVGR